MPAKNEDLHGFVPDKSNVALLLIDVINDLDFGGGEELLRHALPMARRLAELKRRARAAGVPVVYVNDNFGKWQSDFKKILEHCLKDADTRPSNEIDFAELKRLAKREPEPNPEPEPKRATP